MINEKDSIFVVHEAALDVFVSLFNKENKTLEMTVSKDNIAIHEQYTSKSHFLCKYYGLTFGVNEKGVMKPKIEFSITPRKYILELTVEDRDGVSTICFSEKANEANSIKMKIY